MNKERIEVMRGSGNVFRDLNLPNPDLEQLRAILAARIIQVLDRKKLTVRKAHELTGIAAADYSRIRRANIDRFTVDRLMSILNRLAQDVEVSVNVREGAQGAMSENEVADIKRKNIIDMALTFTATMRVFETGSKERIAKKLEEICINLASINSAEEYKDLHREFCQWFVNGIKTAEKTYTKRKTEVKKPKPSGPASYGHAAKILDIVMKVYVYYCDQPTIEVAQRLVKLLNGAVDAKIMDHLLNTKFNTKFNRAPIKTIEQVDSKRYDALQKLVHQDIDESFAGKISPVQYDDVMFWRFNRGAD